MDKIQSAFNAAGGQLLFIRVLLNCDVMLQACPPCMDKIQGKIQSAFNAAGGLGLFFSFTEVGTRRCDAVWIV